MFNEKKIKEQLMQETDEILNVKSDTWQNIQQKLTDNMVISDKQRRKKRLLTMAAIAFITTLIWIGLSTPVGLALIQNVKDMFVPYKTVGIDIEGQKENTIVDLEVNEDLRYAIYVDTSRYKMIETSTSDKIIPIEPLDNKYPEVSMEIVQTETSSETALNNIKQELQELDMNITIEDGINKPLKATFISAIGKGYTNEFGKTGTQWDTPVYQYFVTEEQSGQVFIIKQQYFLEAAEGHGARFDAMLETFEIVE